MGLINLKASLLRWCNNWHKAWNAWNTYQWERFKCSIKTICILWVVKGVFKYGNDWLPTLSSLGIASVCLYPTPLKELFCPLRIEAVIGWTWAVTGSHWGSPAWGFSLSQTRRAPSELSETATSLLILNTIPPLYLRAFALTISTTAFLKIAWSLAPSRPLRICSNVTLFLRPSMKQEPLTTHTQHSLCPI